MGPELEGRVLDQFDEGDEEAPGVGSVHDKPLQQNPEFKLIRTASHYNSSPTW